MLTVGHVWIEQVLGSIVMVGISIRAPVSFSESGMWREHGDSRYTKEDVSDQG